MASFFLRLRTGSLGACKSGAPGIGFPNRFRARRVFCLGACQPRRVWLSFSIGSERDRSGRGDPLLRVLGFPIGLARAARFSVSRVMPAGLGEARGSRQGPCAIIRGVQIRCSG